MILYRMRKGGIHTPSRIQPIEAARPPKEAKLACLERALGCFPDSDPLVIGEPPIAAAKNHGDRVCLSVSGY